MFCRFCGNQIDDDSVFCNHCGKKLATSQASAAPKAPKQTTTTTQTIVVPTDTKDAEKDPSLSYFGIFIGILIFVLIVALVFVAIFNNDLLVRDLTSSDYTCTTSQGLTSYNITIKPKLDVKSCDVTISLSNSSGKEIYSDTITKTELKKGNSYTYTFDFGFINSLSGYKVKYSITGKC